MPFTTHMNTNHVAYFVLLPKQHILQGTHEGFVSIMTLMAKRRFFLLTFKSQ